MCILYFANILTPANTTSIQHSRTEYKLLKSLYNKNKNKKCLFSRNKIILYRQCNRQYIYHFNIMKKELLSVNIYLYQLELKVIISTHNRKKIYRTNMKHLCLLIYNSRWYHLLQML